MSDNLKILNDAELQEFIDLTQSISNREQRRLVKQLKLGTALRFSTENKRFSYLRDCTVMQMHVEALLEI